MLGHYKNFQEAKKALMYNGFEISENRYGVLIYINSRKDLLFLTKYSDGTCKIK